MQGTTETEHPVLINVCAYHLDKKKPIIITTMYNSKKILSKCRGNTQEARPRLSPKLKTHNTIKQPQTHVNKPEISLVPDTSRPHDNLYNKNKITIRRSRDGDWG